MIGEQFSTNKNADAIFAIQPHARDAAAYYADIKKRMAEIGRDPDTCKIFSGMQPIIGESESEALEKQEFHNELVPEEGGMAILSAHLNFDMSKLPPDTEMASREEPELQRMKPRYHKPEGGSFTAREIATRHGQSVSLPQFVGTPKSIADQMQAYFEEVGGDGFMLSASHSPGAIEEFVDLVVPELQRRGLFRTAYKGKTQREILTQKD